MSTWRPIDTAQPLTIDEQRRLDHARQTVQGLQAVLEAVPGHVGVMRRCMAGQPRAAAYDHADGSATAPAWCERHERDTDACARAGFVCSGLGSSSTSDPTGNAAVLPDNASRDLRELLRSLDTLAGAGERVRMLLAAYPTKAAEPAERDGPGGNHCSSCWRDSRTMELVTLSPAGIAYYVGRCRWCGAFKAAHGVDPPLSLLRARHEGRRITTRMVEQALAVDRLKVGKGRRKAGRR